MDEAEFHAENAAFDAAIGFVDSELRWALARLASCFGQRRRWSGHTSAGSGT